MENSKQTKLQVSDVVRNTVSVFGNVCALLEHPNIRKDCDVIVASDISCFQRFVENVDFVVNYEVGSIRRTLGSRIKSGQKVEVWYYPTKKENHEN